MSVILQREAEGDFPFDIGINECLICFLFLVHPGTTEIFSCTGKVFRFHNEPCIGGVGIVTVCWAKGDNSVPPCFQLRNLSTSRIIVSIPDFFAEVFQFCD